MTDECLKLFKKNWYYNLSTSISGKTICNRIKFVISSWLFNLSCHYIYSHGFLEKPHFYFQGVVLVIYNYSAAVFLPSMSKVIGRIKKFRTQNLSQILFCSFFIGTNREKLISTNFQWLWPSPASSPPTISKKVWRMKTANFETKFVRNFMFYNFNIINVTTIEVLKTEVNAKKWLLWLFSENYSVAGSLSSMSKRVRHKQKKLRQNLSQILFPEIFLIKVKTIESLVTELINLRCGHEIMWILRILLEHHYERV